MSKVVELKMKDKKGKIELNNKEDNQELYFYGDIVSDSWCKWSDEDTCPNDVTELLKEIDESKDLNIYINSGGGSVFAGIAIYNQIKRKKCKNKIVHVDGIAASIASVIAFAGDKIIIPETAQLMIHKPWGLCQGDAEEMRSYANFLDKNEEIILDIYEANLNEGIKREEIKEMVSKETWLTGNEASNYFNIEVEKGRDAVACLSSFFDEYKNKPNNINSDENEEFTLLKDKLLLELELSKI